MLVEIPNNRKMYKILIGKHNRQDRTQQQCYLLFTTLMPKFNGSCTLHGNGIGNRTRTRTETMGLYIMPLSVHTTQGQGMGPGLGPGPMGCIPISPFLVPVLCSVFELWGLFTRNVFSTCSLLPLFLLPATKLRQGNAFTPVCHSVHRGGVYLWSRGVSATHIPDQTPPG